jgi:cation diffusion facilitator family transporter
MPAAPGVPADAETASPVDGLREGRRVALAGVLVSALLSIGNVVIGRQTGSLSVLAIGIEFAGDVLASSVVLVGLFVASRPPDANHPYGHGRIETVAGLFVAFVLMAGGVAIVLGGVSTLGEHAVVPGGLAVLALAVTMVVRAVTCLMKFGAARRIGSLALRSDGWNDAVDILSGAAALGAVLLARLDPDAFQTADSWGAIVVGMIVGWTGARLARAATLDLADTMPSAAMIEEAHRVALAVPGVIAVEKKFARKTGLQYHVDLHLEVDPEMSVRESHRIGHEVQARVRDTLPWVADVLVHIEPAGQPRRRPN